MCSWRLSPAWCQFGLNQRSWNRALLGEWVTCIKTRAFIILPSIVVVPWGPHSRSRAQTLLRQAYCKPITQRQALPLWAGNPWDTWCPTIVLFWPPAMFCPVSSSPRASQLDPTSTWDLLHAGCWPHVLWGAQHAQWYNKDTFLPRSLGMLLLDHLCYVLTSVLVCNQPDTEPLPASSTSQCFSAIHFASLDTTFCLHSQIKRQYSSFPPLPWLNCS